MSEMRRGIEMAEMKPPISRKFTMDELIKAAIAHFKAPVELKYRDGVDYVMVEWTGKVEDARAALAAWDAKHMEQMPAGVVVAYRLA